MSFTLSEYPLLPDDELHAEGEALWVEGVGWLGQYHSYLDALWEKGLPYFVRDYYLLKPQTDELVAKIKYLNSKIHAYEMAVTSLSRMYPPPVVRQEPIVPHRQLASNTPPRASSDEPGPDHSSGDISQPSLAPPAAPPKKQPASRKRKATAASPP